MPTLKYPKNPNIETAFVEQDDGTKNRVVMTAPQDISTLEYPSNPNSTKGYVTVNGKKQRVIMVADIVGGGGGGAVTSVNGQTGDVVLSIPDAVQYSTMPTAASTNEGDIVQFIGTTDASYTNGYFYKCVSDGLNPATYSWVQVNVQPAGSSLPSQTGQSGKFLTTDGTDASWATINALQNTATGTDSLTVLGTVATFGKTVNIGSDSGGNARCTVIGYNAGGGVGGATDFIAIGCNAKVTATNAIQIGGNSHFPEMSTNSTYGTVKIYNGNGNFEIMSADGTIPTDRLTKVNSTITLTAAGWSSNTQTVSVTGMTATGVVLVSPDPTDQADYTTAGIICTAQATNSLTFTCSTTPTSDIDVVVIML